MHLILAFCPGWKAAESTLETENYVEPILLLLGCILKPRIRNFVNGYALSNLMDIFTMISLYIEAKGMRKHVCSLHHCVHVDQSCQNHQDVAGAMIFWSTDAVLLGGVDLQMQGPVGRCRWEVQCIERVQNKRLWERYAFRKKELLAMHGYTGDNESWLFHGADKLALEAIVNEGFDMRIANAGSLGKGKGNQPHADGVCAAITVLRNQHVCPFDLMIGQTMG